MGRAAFRAVRRESDERMRKDENEAFCRTTCAVDAMCKGLAIIDGLALLAGQMVEELGSMVRPNIEEEKK